MLALLLPLLLAASAAAQNAQNLTINNLPPPALGIDLNFDPSPAFTWQLVAPQTAYQLVVTTAAGAPAWDSGVVASPSASQVLYAGAPLAPDADYAVTLTSHTAAGPSAPLQGAFSTGPDAAAWAASAVWLGGCTGGQAAPQLRRAFTLSPAPVLRARAYASAAGLYTLHLNGARVGGGGEGALGGDVLTPGWATVPTVRLEAQAYDVAAVLRAGGENVVGLRLGEGKFGYVFEFCHAGDATCYAGVLRLVITQAGGNTTVLQTDASGAWECAPSPITFQHLFHGESYNASLEQAGWDAPGFAPLAPWAPAPLRAPNATLLSTGVPPIRNAAAVAPLALWQAPGGAPYIAGGKFVIASSGGDPEVYWWADNTTTKNPVAFCSMCGLEVCGALVPEPPAVLAALTLGPNFTCSQLPAGPGAWVFDLGRNMAGVCSLSLPGPGAAAPGSTLTLVHGEILTGAGGAVHNTFGTSGTSRGCPVNTINCADQADFYTFGSHGSQGGAYTPSFTFHGFRYVGLFGWPAAPAPPPTLATLTCHQQRTDMQAAGGLSFANPVLNRLQAAIAQTQASNFFSIPSDCPTREKRGWGGDASVSAGQALYNLRAVALYQNWVRSMAETAALGCNDPSALAQVALGSAAAASPQRPPEYLCCGKRSEFGCQPGLTPTNATGSLPDVLPFDSISGWPGDYVWQSIGVEIPSLLLAHEGNVVYQARVFGMVWGLLGFAAANTDPASGLLRWGPYGDWLAGNGVATGFVENWYLRRGALQGAEIAAALGLGSQAAALVALGARVDAALVRAYFSPSAGVWSGGGGMNLQAMALAGGVGGAATANATASTIAAMLADAAAQGYHTTSGLASSRWILAGLAWAGNGSSDAAYRMVNNTSAPGWGYMVSDDSMPGTIWESWKGDAFSSDGSKNHPMFSGGIGVWLYENALGLRFAHRLPAAPSSQPPCPLLAFSPQLSLGLSDALARAACSVAAAAPPGASLADLHASILRATATADADADAAPSITPAPALLPTLTLAPAASVMRALGAASGWHAAPQGRCALAWALGEGGLSLNASVPHGVRGRVALPLEVVRQFPVLRVALGGAGAGAGAGVEATLQAQAGEAAGCALLSQRGSEFQLSLCSSSASSASASGAALGAVARAASLATEAQVEGAGRQWGLGQALSWQQGALLFAVEGGQHSFSLRAA